MRYGHMGEHVADNLNGIGLIVDDDRREIDSAASKTLLDRERRIRADPIQLELQHLLGTDRRAEKLEGGRIPQRGVPESTEHERVMDRGVTNCSRRTSETAWSVWMSATTRGNMSLSGWASSLATTSMPTLCYGRRRRATRSRPRSRPNTRWSASCSTRTLNGQGTWIHVLRADQFFTKDLFLRLFFQTNSAIDRKNTQVVFVYRYLPPFGTIQVAYQRGTAAFGQRSTQGDTLFLKATTVF